MNFKSTRMSRLRLGGSMRPISIFGKAKNLFSALYPSNPTWLQITNNNQALNFTPSLANSSVYLTVNSTITNFKIIVDGTKEVIVTNYFDPTDINNCSLDLVPVDPTLVSCTPSTISVTENSTLSTNLNNLYTFYYYNTGSLILGMSRAGISIPAPSAVPPLTSIPVLPIITPTPSTTPTPTLTETPTLTGEVPTPTLTETPTLTGEVPTPTPT